MAIPFKDNVDQSGVTPVLALVLLHAVTNLHILHWQSKSFAQHVTLGELYSAVEETTDEFVEAYMGKYGQLDNLPEFYSAPNSDPVKEVETLYDHITALRQELPQDSELQQLVDNIVDSLDSALYKLRFLK